MGFLDLKTMFKILSNNLAKKFSTRSNSCRLDNAKNLLRLIVVGTLIEILIPGITSDFEVQILKFKTNFILQTVFQQQKLAQFSYLSAYRWSD